MTNEIIKREEDFLDLGRLAALEKLGAYLAKSRMFPNIQTPEQAMTIVQYGRELGYGPIVSLQEIFVINGRLSTSAKSMLALFQMSGGRIEVLEWTDAICKIRFTKADFKPLDYTYTVEDARKAGLFEKRGRWQVDPRTMVYWRCISGGIRAFDPMTTMGLYLPEEIEEIQEEAENAPGPGYKAEEFKKPEPAPVAEEKPAEAEEKPTAPPSGPIPVENKPEPPKAPRQNALTPKPSAKPKAPPIAAPPAPEVKPLIDPTTGKNVAGSIAGEFIAEKLAYIKKEFGKDFFAAAKTRAESDKIANRPLPDFPEGLTDNESTEIIKVLDATIRLEAVKKEGAK